MATPRRRAPLTEGLGEFPPGGLLLRVRAGDADDPAIARLARTAVQWAAAHAGAAVMITRRTVVGSALRGAREVGVEPRVLVPGNGVGLSARMPLSLPLQGERALPAFVAASAFAADFVADACSGGTGTPDAAVRKAVVSAIAKGRDGSSVGLDFAAVAAHAKAALGRSNPASAKAEQALRSVESAENTARAFASPVAWESLAAPSPAGRRAGVLLDLSPFSPQDAAAVEAISMASLAAAAPQVAEALGGGPLILLADEPVHALGRFAAKRLSAWGCAGPAPFLGLLLAQGEGEEGDRPTVATLGAGGLQLPNGTSALPLAPAPDLLLPLSTDEVRGLTPAPMRARLLSSGPPEEEDDGAGGALMDGPRPAASESFAALKEATGDLEAIARKRHRPAPKAPARQGTYEASDFDLQ